MGDEKEIRSRIDFVDLVKGLCIILIVMSHVAGAFDKLDYHNMISCFRIPLYFFISGIFFKSYEGFVGFLIRKVNKLLIPFLFFYLAAFALMFTASKVAPHLFQLPVRWSELLYVFRGHELIRFNPPIWFLLALFNCCLLFYIVHFLREKHVRLMFVCVLVIGAAGFVLGKCQIELPLYMDVAMTALPYYFCGFWIRRYNFFLFPHNRFDKWIPLLVVFAIVMMYFTATFVGMRTNNYHGNIFQFYVAAFAGILMIMLVGKWFKHIPFVSYVGRYSIITLGVHGPLLHFVMPVALRYIHNEWLLAVIVLVVILLICRAVTPLFVRYFPTLVAQKEMIRTS
jgi:fucose 4-O-acetylase-like acetyltransferase